jgi:plastocyanin
VRRPPLPESLIVVAAVGVLTGAALGLLQDGDAPPPPASAGGTEVAIAEFAFAPAELTVSIGDTVTWTNRDSAAHTVTASPGGAIDSGNLEQDDAYQVTFEEGGSFSYLCVYHPFMTATVTVQG